MQSGLVLWLLSLYRYQDYAQGKKVLLPEQLQRPGVGAAHREHLQLREMPKPDKHGYAHI